MATIEEEVIKTVKLVLTEEEATWLKGLMQNPLNGHQNDEDTYNREMRYEFWRALDNKTGKY